MKITKVVEEVWSSNPTEPSLSVIKMTVTHDIVIDPDELPKLVDSCVSAGLGDIKPILMEFLENINKKNKYQNNC